MGEKGSRNNPDEIPSPCIPSCATFSPVEVKIQDDCFLPWPKKGTTSQVHRNKARNLLAALRQSSSALGFEGQLYFCFPGRATVRSQRHDFSFCTGKETHFRKNVACNKRPDTLESCQRYIQPGTYIPPWPPTEYHQPNKRVVMSLPPSSKLQRASVPHQRSCLFL